MKELSIEEKVYDGNYKAYTELINRLEDVKDAIKKQNYGIAMDILCKPYPEFQITTSTELAESEDERIRKALIDIVNARCELYKGITKEMFLAWLEKQGEQKSAWSEEDEEIHRKCICAMRASACGFPEEEKFVEQVDNWLNSLKERVQQRQEWSEDDESTINEVILNYKSTYLPPVDKRYNIINRLESLKDRYTWKPSDEQMKALAYAVFDTQSYSYHKNLSSLEQQLKKLREE